MTPSVSRLGSGSRDDDETTPLLLDSSISNAEAQNITEHLITPFPTAQLSALCLIRVIDPIAFSQIFPYINELIFNLHVTDDPSQIGYFSGLVESVFAISQLLAIYQWARLSDIFGRRPIIMCGTIGFSIATMSFGLSKTLVGLLICRFIAGMFAGTSSVIHTALGEITDHTNQAAAFSIYGLVWPLGSIIGPFIGGELSSPAAKFKIFKDTIFDRNPYFLPCFISGLLSLSAFAIAYFCLTDNSPSKRTSPEKSQATIANDDIDTSVTVLSPSPSIKELLSFPIIRALNLAGFALEANGNAFTVLFVLFCYTPIESGGLAFPPSTIGNALAFSGFTHAILQIFFLPMLMRRFEVARIYNISVAAWPITFLLFPLLNIIARYGLEVSTKQISPRSNAALWIGLVIVLALSRIGSIAFSASLILIKNNVPKPSYLAATNGLVQASMCFARFISPALASSLFAFSGKYNILGGYLWALVYAFIALAACSLARDITRNGKNMLSS